MRFRDLFIPFILILYLSSCQQKSGLIESLMRNSGKFDAVLNNVEKHRIQIIYTQIDRDQHNKPSFKTHQFRLNNQEYFYPASSIKLPLAALALEKINDLHINGLHPFAKIQVDSTFSGQSSVYYDSTSHIGFPSIGHYIKKLFLVSDNDAYNRLYEFLGQHEANTRLIDKGFNDIRITHRLSIPLSVEENKHTNPMRFYQGESFVYDQDEQYNAIEIKAAKPIALGDRYMKDEKLENNPMDFTYKNAIGLASLHDVLLRIIFSEKFPANQQFHLKEENYQFLYENMSKYPRESDFPIYGSGYPDGYCKFLMLGGADQNTNSNLRIYNKIGQAYGFLIDMAYIIDFEKKIEFVLGAVIYVNENNILNDGVYEYEMVGLPFMRDLGQVIYDFERTRNRLHPPDLSKYNWNSWKK